MHFLTASATDRGRRRLRNEDSTLVVKGPASSEAFDWVLLAVADGMGGLADGDIASRTAVGTLEGVVVGAPEGIMDSDLLLDAFLEAHKAIRRLSERAQLMATTMVSALARLDGRVTVANVGDSRCYVVEPQGMIRVTRDHSAVARQVAEGRMTEAEASSSPMRRFVSRSLGYEQDAPKVDTFGPLNVGPGCSLLLCSDGLYRFVDEGEMVALAREFPPQEAADGLVRLANERGGLDNISVVIAAVQGTPIVGRRGETGWPVDYK